ncbi:putative phage portal protein [Klebsiella variicola]|uniref:phage portal protein n=1 Tax=Klebsiella/Raoultella group TaxID=2890311 RepID=UPI000D74BE23|nr:phage portal protein [Klebsiella variicola]WJT90231.1 phage portal protein [Klebsiella pneumoniae]HCF8324199.1 phage portal protein [Klebsiella variicola subsp. variicola]PXH33331.1 phage portal protein [Klebsiella variicola]SXD75649.1 putative phage portal protein [Klebsiella variicola]HBR4053224.1 phage portal protein [Klebsiella pneumoniae]
MKKKYHRSARNAGKQAAQGNKKMSVLRFGKPEPVLTTGTDYRDVWYDNDYDHYTLPIDRLALAQLINLNGQHGGIIHARKNLVIADYIGGGLSHDQIEAGTFDFLTFGDLAIVKVRNGWGDVIALEPMPGLYMRRRKDGDFVVLQHGEPLVYPPEDVIFIKMYDPQQQIYGLPDYIGGIHSALLNSEAVIFRRRYYHNGAHTGGILYTTDANMTDEIEEEIEAQLANSKGIGNFSTILVNIPNGDKEGVQFIQMGDIGAKDEFANVKNISAQDVLNAHRFPAGLAGIIPQNTGGLGDPEKTERTYKRSEVRPFQRRLTMAINGDPEIPPRLHLHFLDETTEKDAA